MVELQSDDYMLTIEDRCDACTAQAYVYVLFESGDLLFCLHHWKEHQNNVAEAAKDVLDESHRLLVR